MADYAEELFNAIQTIVDKSIDKVSYDKTIVCTIVDNSKASQGEYIVSDGSASFTAYSEKTNYTKGAQIYVTIPQGNYENKKLIVGKYLGDEDTPYIYTPPTENYVNMTGDLISNSSTIYYLLANNNDIKELSSIISLTDLGLIGYDRLGVSAEFQTLLSAYDIIGGNYGLKFEISGIRNDGEINNTILYLDSDDMFGNPYNFTGMTKQEKVFDISSYSEIQDIYISFYQHSNFIDSTGELIRSTIPNTTQNLLENLLVSNIQINAGYDYSLFDKETILLYTLNSKIFSAEDSQRNLQARFIYLNDSGTYTQMGDIPYYSIDGIIVSEEEKANYKELEELQAELDNIDINQDAEIETLNQEDFETDEDYVNAIQDIVDNYTIKKNTLKTQLGLAVGQYIIHWYQWDLAPDVYDGIAGAFWKEIYPQSAYNCNVELRGTAKAHEHFKVIIEENLNSGTETLQKKYYESEVLEFTNENGSVETNLAVDLVSGLTLSTSDDYNGIYAIYSGDGKLMNQTDSMKDRYVVVSYQSLVTGLTEFDGAESITWQVPGNNTMIIIPEEQEGLEFSQDPLTKIITLQGKIEEHDDDSDIIGENNVRGAKLKFRINPIYSQINTNNTVKCLITRQGFQYAASMTMHFSPAGTNGTDYTLVLEIDNNQSQMALPLNDSINFAGLRVIAQLQDYENKPIDGKISLSFENDPSLIFEDSSAENKKTITINAGETATINRNSSATTGYGMVVANTYVYVANKKAGDKKDEDEEVSSRQIMLTAYLPLSYADKDYINDLIEGPVRVIYDGGGSNPVYTKLPYNLYNNGVLETQQINWLIQCQNNGEERYIGKIIDGLYTPPVMLINNLGSVYAIGLIDGNKIWSQRILLQINRFGSSMLNKWDGSLTIDEENNQILSSIIGAGSKDSSNQFSGVIMGDIGKDIENASTGLYGYNKGQQSFGFLSDGTAFLGKTGKGQIQFDGNKGIIKSGNYEKNKAGLLLDLDDSLIDSKLFKIDGSGKNKNVLSVYGFNEVDSNDNEINNFESLDSKLLMQIGNSKYFLQSANFDEDNFTGFQLNLSKNKITGYSTKLDFYNIGEKKYLPSGKIVKTNNIETISVYYKENNTNKIKTYECYYSEDLLLQDNKYYCGENGNSGLDIFEGLQDVDWCYSDDIKIAPSIGDYESLLTIDSGAKQYPLWIESSRNKTFKLGWDGSMQATSGMIGNWIIDSNSLTTNGGKIGMAGWKDKNGPIFWSGGKALNYPGTTWHDQVGFGVSAQGELFANDGAIGGWKLSNTGFSVSVGDYDEYDEENEKYYKYVINTDDTGLWKYENGEWQECDNPGDGTHDRIEISKNEIENINCSITSKGIAKFKDIYLDNKKLYAGWVYDTHPVIKTKSIAVRSGDIQTIIQAINIIRTSNTWMGAKDQLANALTQLNSTTAVTVVTGFDEKASTVVGSYRAIRYS